MDEWDRYVETAKANRSRRKELRFAAEAGHVWGLAICAACAFVSLTDFAATIFLILR